MIFQSSHIVFSMFCSFNVSVNVFCHRRTKKKSVFPYRHIDIYVMWEETHLLWVLFKALENKMEPVMEGFGPSQATGPRWRPSLYPVYV